MKLYDLRQSAGTVSIVFQPCAESAGFNVQGIIEHDHPAYKTSNTLKIQVNISLVYLKIQFVHLCNSFEVNEQIHRCLPVLMSPPYAI